MYILGVSALYHDSSAALINDGEIIAAAQEERFTRIKHDASIPENAIRYCLNEAKIEADDLEAVVYYDDPILTLDRFLSNLLSVKDEDISCLLDYSFESIFRDKMWIADDLEQIIGGLGKREKLLISKHHMSHAASAFYPSPFDQAAIITVDGVGEWNTTTIGCGSGNKITILKEINYPHSLGLLYSAFTYFCGFKVNYGDYKLMGLAPYGEPVYYDMIKEELIDIKEDGSFRLNLEYFDFQNGRSMTNDKFAQLFGGNRRMPESMITHREMNMAASVQKIVEEVIEKLALTARTLTKQCDNLVMAGGVALNCVANGVLRRKNIFKNIWIQPAAGDAGGALGAAMLVYYGMYGRERINNGKDKQKGSLLGPEYKADEIQNFLVGNRYIFHRFLTIDELCRKLAEELDAQKIIGIFEGRMEFGPRALGNRSIIADPRSDDMQVKLNISIKHRESFRPFAPIVLKEAVNKYFDLDGDSPYMLFCDNVKNKCNIEFSAQEYLKKNSNLLPIINMKRSDIPAVTHIDYSARIQTVTEESNNFLYNILKAFEERTACSVLVNTSFNVRGEPIVCTLEDAYDCFMNTDMDILVMGNCLLYKQEQQKGYKIRRKSYELD